MSNNDDKLKIERDRFVALAFCRADLLFELSDDRTVVFAAGATPPLLGRQPAKLSGTPFLDLIAEEDRSLTADLFKAASNKGRMDDIIVRLNGVKGLKPAVAISGYRVPDFDNHFFLALKVEPVREHQIAEDNLERDEATGLLSGDSFSEVAAQKVLAYQRAGGTAQMSLVKIDNLSELLSKLGMTDRRKLLEGIGGVLKKNSLGGNLAGAIDEENYTFIHTDEVDPEAVNREIEDYACQVNPDDCEDIQSRSSTLEADGAEMTEEQVAKALTYSMKKFTASDGNLKDINIAEALEAIMMETVENVAYFKDVYNTGAFDLAFQPIVDLRRGKVHHFEALTRFRGDAPGGGSPYHLISMGEEVGIIHEFDMAVCKKAILAIRKFNKTEVLPAVAVNLSGKSIENAYFVHSLHEILDANPDLANNLLFEITESAQIENLELVNEVVQGLRKKGFHVCLDDFGAGAASFDYLNSLDVDVVKFDGPVVRRATTTAKGRDMLSSMAKMCSKLGVDTVAEMVEDKAMGRQLHGLGITYAQGWGYGKPSLDPFEFRQDFGQRLIDVTR